MAVVGQNRPGSNYPGVDLIRRSKNVSFKTANQTPDIDFIGALGTATSKTSSTTLVIDLTSAINAEVGNLLLVQTSWDNEGTTDADTSQLSVSDSNGHT